MPFFKSPNKPLPHGYPLAALDANGVSLAPGMFARILTIPNWLTHDLPRDEISRLQAVQGTVLRILELDTYGMVWLGEDTPWFCLKPSEVMAVAPPSQNVI